MLERLNAEDFRRVRPKPFTLQAPAGPVELRVLEVVEREAAPGVAASFSVVFRGPTLDLLPQAMYEVSHPELGAFPLFIVPVGADPDGFRYEAVFTRLDS